MAVSGGGDSVALLYTLAEWQQRPLHVFCVDHGLNPQSPQWTRSVADHATKLGASFTALYWTGDKPTTGLSAAARSARHRLLAEAARQNGVRVLCLGHTADDIAEAGAMRDQGSNVGTPTEWTPSPIWPQGRGIFLYRPFLDIRRSALRDYLRAIGANWIDDPANENPASLRARTRADLAEVAVSAPVPVMPFDLNDLIDPTFGAVGVVALNLLAFAALPIDQRLRVLSAAAVCAGGGDRLPRRSERETLLSRLPHGKALTLCGARLHQTDTHILIARDAGDMRRRARPIADGIWDGRFEIATADITASQGLRRHLNESDQAVIARLPAIARDSLPVLKKQPVFGKEPILGKAKEIKLLSAYDSFSNTETARCLVLPRLYAALGAIRRESDL